MNPPIRKPVGFLLVLLFMGSLAGLVSVPLPRVGATAFVADVEAAGQAVATVPEADPLGSPPCRAPGEAQLSSEEPVRPEEGNGHISGRVQTTAGDALADVMVQALGRGRVWETVRTDAQGRYGFSDLPEGRYTLLVVDTDGQALELVGDNVATPVAPPDAAGDVLLRVVPPVSQPTPTEASTSASAAQTSGITPAQTGVITGTVTAEDTGDPQENVAVRLYTATGESPEDFGVTDANGSYEFDALEAGDYRIAFDPPSFGAASVYAGEFYNNKLSLASADRITVVEAGTTSNINASLTLGSTITGTVTAEDTGDPLEDVTVRLYTATENSPKDTEFTDANGIYEFDGLGAGGYRIEFDPPSFGAASVYVGEFYDNQVSLERADLITITATSTISNINAILTLGSTITGTVTAEDTGDPLEDVTVRLYPASSSAELDNVATSVDGSYTFNGVQAGSYRLEFDPPFSGPASVYLGEFYNNKLSLESANLITVSATSTISNINAILTLGSTITGTVTAEDTSNPLQSVIVRLYDNTGTSVDTDFTDADGRYAFETLRAGSYRLEFDPSSGSSRAYLQEFYNNKRTLELADPVVVAVGGSATINAALTRGGSITGTVTAEDTGNPLERVQVRLYSAIGETSVASVSTGANGRYQFEGLEAGIYQIGFQASTSSITVTRNYLNEFYNDRATLDEADRITVTTSSTMSNINAALKRGGTIRGQVTAVDTSAGLEDVRVHIYDFCTGDFVTSFETDATGNYVTAALRDGRYVVVFDPPNFGTSAARDYLGEYYNDKPGFEVADAVQVTAPNVSDGINAVLTRGGRITGRVTAADTDNALNEVTVSVYDSTGDWIASGDTAPDGTYQVRGLNGGSYRVGFDPLFGDSRAYLDEYYNDQATLAAAETVTVTLSQTTSGIDAALARGGSISGRVTAADTGAGLENVSVQVTRIGGGSYSANTEADGRYRVEGLSGGSYEVTFRTPGSTGTAGDYAGEVYNDQPLSGPGTPVTVTVPNDTANIDAALARGGTIQGQITAVDSGNPLGNVGISVYDSDLNFVATGSANADGTYSIAGIPAGSYIVEFDPLTFAGSDAYAYLPEYYNNTSSASAADLVTVIGAQVTANIDAALARGGSISGQVTATSTGKLLRDIWVVLYDADGDFVDGTFTDATGSYRFDGLQDGAYKVKFETSFNRCEEVYVGEYYNNQPTLEAADIVMVNAPVETRNINASLAVGGTIRGRVTAADTSLPLDNVDVLVYDSQGNQVGSTETDEQGNYRTAGLASGSYRLAFDPPSSGAARVYVGEFYNDQATLAAATPIAVTAPNETSGIDAVLTRGGTISGRVTAADTSNGLDDVAVDIFDSSGVFVGSVTTNANGEYTTIGLRSGDYRLEFDPFGDASGYALEYYNDKGTLAEADAVTVTAPNGTTGIDAVLSPGGSISGRVTAEATSAGLAEISVRVYASDGKQVGSATTSATGVYTTSAVRTGSYVVEFAPLLDSPYAAEFYNNKPTQEDADPVAVTSPNVTPGIDAALAEVRGITGVTLEGPAQGEVGTAYTFTARILPVNAPTPFTYTWSADNQSPVPRRANRTSATDSLSLTWSVTGTQTIRVTVADRTGNVVTDTITIAIGTPASAITGVRLEGPDYGDVGAVQSFTAHVLPANAPPPFTYTWTADNQAPIQPHGNRTNPTDSLSLTWTVTGTQRVTVTVTDGTGKVVTDTLTIALLAPAASIASVALAGPQQGEVGTAYGFTAQVQPLNAPPPFTYTWRADNQGAIAPHTNRTSATDQLTLTWTVTGTQDLMVTVADRTGKVVTDTWTIAIGAPGTMHELYLPFTRR